MDAPDQYLAKAIVYAVKNEIKGIDQRITELTEQLPEAQRTLTSEREAVRQDHEGLKADRESFQQNVAKYNEGVRKLAGVEDVCENDHAEIRAAVKAVERGREEDKKNIALQISSGVSELGQSLRREAAQSITEVKGSVQTLSTEGVRVEGKVDLHKSELQAQIRLLGEQLKSEMKAEITKQQEALRLDNNSLKTRLDSAEQDVRDMRGKLAVAEYQLTTSEKRFKGLEDKYETLQKIVEESKANHDQLERRLVEVEITPKQDSQQASDALSLQVDTLSKQVNADLDKLRQRMTSFDTAQNIQIDRVDRIEKNRETETRVINARLEKMTGSVSTPTQMSYEYKTLKSRVESVEGECRGLQDGAKQTKTDVDAQLDKLRQRMTESDATRKTHSDRLKGLEDNHQIEVDSTKARHENLEEQMRILAQTAANECKALKTKIDTIESEHKGMQDTVKKTKPVKQSKSELTALKTEANKRAVLEGRVLALEEKERKHAEGATQTNSDLRDLEGRVTTSEQVCLALDQRLEGVSQTHNDLATSLECQFNGIKEENKKFTHIETSLNDIGRRIGALEEKALAPVYTPPIIRRPGPSSRSAGAKKSSNSAPPTQPSAKPLPQKLVQQNHIGRMSSDPIARLPLPGPSAARPSFNPRPNPVPLGTDVHEIPPSPAVDNHSAPPAAQPLKRKAEADPPARHQPTRATKRPMNYKFISRTSLQGDSAAQETEAEGSNTKEVKAGAGEAGRDHTNESKSRETEAKESHTGLLPQISAQTYPKPEPATNRDDTTSSDLSDAPPSSPPRKELKPRLKLYSGGRMSAEALQSKGAAKAKVAKTPKTPTKAGKAAARSSGAGGKKYPPLRMRGQTSEQYAAAARSL